MNNRLIIKKDVILILILVLLLIVHLGNLSAGLDGVKQGQCIRIGADMGDSNNANLTIHYPLNKSFVIENINMTYSHGDYFYYDFCTNFNSPLGRYDYEYYNATRGSMVSNYFIVTPTGSIQTESQGITSFGFLFLMVSLTFIIGFLGFKFFESEYLWVMGLFFIFLMFLFVVYDVWLGYEFHRNWTGIDGSGIPEIIFYIFLFILVSSLVVSGILLFTHWEKLKDWFRKSKEDYERMSQEDERNWR